MRADLDLKLVSLVALAGVLAGTILESPTVRVLPAALLVLAAPGYALSVVVLPALREHAERWLLACGLSFVVDVFVGLFLDRIGVGLSARSWSVALGIVTLVLAVLAGARRAATIPRAVVRRRRPPVRSAVRPAGVLATGAVVTLAVVAVLIARQPAGSAHVRGYSALWALPGKQVGNVLHFTVGVGSDELETTGYELVGAVGQRVVFRRVFSLSPGGRWRGAGSALFSTRNGPFLFPQPVRLLLYRGAARGKPYRLVFLSPRSGA